MELTPEERRRIYEEEKAKIEAGEPQPSGDKKSASTESTIGMAENVAGLLCYLGFWISGLIIYILEHKNKRIRFYAAQSLVTFGSLFVASMLLGWIPVVGVVFSTIIGITGFILWIVLMVKAYNGEHFKVPLAGDIAEMMASYSGAVNPATATPVTPPPGPPATEQPEPAAVETVAAAEPTERKTGGASSPGQAGRIVASSFAIAWSIILVIFFNFFHDYVAYYNVDTAGRVLIWTRDSFFTSDISLWLPILNATMGISIVGHIFLIIFDKYLLRKIVMLVTAAFGLATMITLLAVFPFDFSAIPNVNAEVGTQIGVTAVLVIITIAFGITTLVRLIQLLLDIARGKTRY